MSRLALAFLSIVLAACGLGPQDNFTLGRELDRCDRTFPFCGYTAGCVLGTGKYVEGRFPGTKSFIVPAPAESFIRVRIFFATQEAIGDELQVLWDEPGCFDTYEWTENSIDIFRRAGNDRVLEHAEQVFLDGDHLVRVRSNVVADYVIVVEVMSPSEAR